MSRLLVFGVIVAAGVLFGGCAAPIPTYGPVSTSEAIRVLAGRAERVGTLSGTCRVTLTTPEGDSVRLDGAVAAAPPDRFRLRAWKFSRPVLDLTVVGEDVWIATPAEPRDGAPPAGGLAEMPVGQLSAAWALVMREFYTGSDVQERPALAGAGDRSDMLILVRRLDDGSEAVCEVDRRTLTPRRFIIAPAAGEAEHIITLERWRTIDGVEWPTRLSFRGEPGRIDIALDDIELNAELAEGAFTPPRRAVWQP